MAVKFEFYTFTSSESETATKVYLSFIINYYKMSTCIYHLKTSCKGGTISESFFTSKNKALKSFENNLENLIHSFDLHGTLIDQRKYYNNKEIVRYNTKVNYDFEVTLETVFISTQIEKF